MIRIDSEMPSLLVKKTIIPMHHSFLHPVAMDPSILHPVAMHPSSRPRVDEGGGRGKEDGCIQ